MAQQGKVWPSDSGERMDIYDEYRHATGRTMLRGTPVEPGAYLTVIHVCIFNAAGQMLIQQRQASKKAFPSLWDITVGGAVQSGETSREAAMREVGEELGLALDLSGIRPYLTVNFSDGFDDIYIVEREVEPAALHLQASEVSAVRWATLPEILSLADSGVFIPYYRGFLQLLFEMKDQMGFLREN
ncbi:MAG: NUDIX domain-containing protein [Oscillibacter sp.]|jgi:isopentenyldiphosphate isomerase|nr:NUDIX domain-containing protein [Oscillibacter sp.]